MLRPRIPNLTKCKALYLEVYNNNINLRCIENPFTSFKIINFTSNSFLEGVNSLDFCYIHKIKDFKAGTDTTTEKAKLVNELMEFLSHDCI